ACSFRPNRAEHPAIRLHSPIIVDENNIILARRKFECQLAHLETGIMLQLEATTVSINQVWLPAYIDTKQNSMTMQMMLISQIKPNPRNLRTHPAKQVRQIANSIVAFKFRSPCLVNQDGELIAGHGRYLAAKLLGLTKIPVIV